jgi:hypothetical protein
VEEKDIWKDLKVGGIQFLPPGKLSCLLAMGSGDAGAVSDVGNGGPCASRIGWVVGQTWNLR